MARGILVHLNDSLVISERFVNESTAGESVELLEEYQTWRPENVESTNVSEGLSEVAMGDDSGDAGATRRGEVVVESETYLDSVKMLPNLTALVGALNTSNSQILEMRSTRVVDSTVTEVDSLNATLMDLQNTTSWLRLRISQLRDLSTNLTVVNVSEEEIRSTGKQVELLGDTSPVDYFFGVLQSTIPNLLSCMAEVVIQFNNLDDKVLRLPEEFFEIERRLVELNASYHEALPVIHRLNETLRALPRFPVERLVTVSTINRNITRALYGSGSSISEFNMTRFERKLDAMEAALDDIELDGIVDAIVGLNSSIWDDAVLFPTEMLDRLLVAGGVVDAVKLTLTKALDEIGLYHASKRCNGDSDAGKFGVSCTDASDCGSGECETGLAVCVDPATNEPDPAYDSQARSVDCHAPGLDSACEALDGDLKCSFNASVVLLASEAVEVFGDETPTSADLAEPAASLESLYVSLASADFGSNRQQLGTANDTLRIILEVDESGLQRAEEDLSPSKLRINSSLIELKDAENATGSVNWEEANQQATNMGSKFSLVRAFDASLAAISRIFRRVEAYLFVDLPEDLELITYWELLRVRTLDGAIGLLGNIALVLDGVVDLVNDVGYEIVQLRRLQGQEVQSINATTYQQQEKAASNVSADAALNEQVLPINISLFSDRVIEPFFVVMTYEEYHVHGPVYFFGALFDSVYRAYLDAPSAIASTSGGLGQGGGVIGTQLGFGGAGNNRIFDQGNESYIIYANRTEPLIVLHTDPGVGPNALMYLDTDSNPWPDGKLCLLLDCLDNTVEELNRKPLTEMRLPSGISLPAALQNVALTREEITGIPWMFPLLASVIAAIPAVLYWSPAATITRIGSCLGQFCSCVCMAWIFIAFGGFLFPLGVLIPADTCYGYANVLHNYIYGARGALCDTMTGSYYPEVDECVMNPFNSNRTNGTIEFTPHRFFRGIAAQDCTSGDVEYFSHMWLQLQDFLGDTLEDQLNSTILEPVQGQPGEPRPPMIEIMIRSTRNLTEVNNFLIDDTSSVFGCRPLNDAVTGYTSAACCEFAEAWYWVVSSYYLIAFTLCLCTYPASFLGYKRVGSHIFGEYYEEAKALAKAGKLKRDPSQFINRHGELTRVKSSRTKQNISTEPEEEKPKPNPTHPTGAAAPPRLFSGGPHAANDDAFDISNPMGPRKHKK